MIKGQLKCEVVNTNFFFQYKGKVMYIDPQSHLGAQCKNMTTSHYIDGFQKKWTNISSVVKM